MSQLTFFQQRQTFNKAKEEFDSLLKNKLTNFNVKATLFLLTASWLILLFFFKKLPPQVPLLYSKPWGESQLADKELMFLLPGISSLLSFINLRLASFFFKDERFLGLLMVWLNFTVVTLATITLIRILLIIN